MQAVRATIVALDVESSSPPGPRQTKRTRDHKVAMLTQSRDLAVCNLLNSMSATTRMCLAFPSCLKARIARNCRSRCMFRVLAHPICTSYLLVLRARAASRIIARRRTLVALAMPPPRLDQKLDFETLSHTTPWLTLYDDSKPDVITLYNRVTGATRVAPWIALRTLGGRVYFANLVTRVTRWLPPPCWQSGWIELDSDRSTHALLSLNGGMKKHSYYMRMLLPHSLAKLRIEGGAPFVHPLDSIK